MQNLYDRIRSDLHFNKFEVGELLFVEYSCPLENKAEGIWTQSDYLVHVLSGKKTWRTPQGRWTVTPGETLYIKKGAAIVEQFFDDEFCMLGFFISDDYIKSILKEISNRIDFDSDGMESHAAVVEVHTDVILSAYFQSMLTYFSGGEKPSDSLLELKLKELIINILTGPHNPSLAAYFQSLLGSEKPAIQQIMDANFSHNLSLEEFARLCHRSVSSFKRDFKKHFSVSPGKWLLTRRLEYSTLLLKNSDLNITEIAFECGFEDVSHFSKAFKEKVGLSPINFRKEVSAKNRRPAESWSP
jgi:AraC family transcriptional regulator, exoenzyme S synthesis regulatory protein ExsA